MNVIKENNSIIIKYGEIVALFTYAQSIHNRFDELFERTKLLKEELPEKEYNELLADVGNSRMCLNHIFEYYENLSREIFDTDEFWEKNYYKDIKTWIRPGYHLELFTSLKYLCKILREHKNVGSRTIVRDTINLVRKVYCAIADWIRMVDDSDNTISSFSDARDCKLKYSVWV